MLSPCASFVFASSVPSSFASSSTPSCPRAWAAAGTGSGSRRLGNRRLLLGAGGARTSPVGPRRGREGRSASAAAEGGKARESPPEGGLGGGRPTGWCGLDPGHEFASVDGPCCARVFIGKGPEPIITVGPDRVVIPRPRFQPEARVPQVPRVACRVPVLNLRRACRRSRRRPARPRFQPEARVPQVPRVACRVPVLT